MLGKVRDRFTLGAICGVVAALPWRLLNTWEYRQGHTEMKYGQLAAGLFVPAGAVDDPAAAVVGRIANEIVVAGTGVAIVYVLSVSGRDKAWLKGAGLTSMLWLSLYGLTTRMGIASDRPRRASTILLSFLDHAGVGASIGLLASGLGHESLFPAPSRAHTVPLVGCLDDQPCEAKSASPAP